MENKKKFKFTFKLGLLVYSLVLVVLIFAGLAFFWNFISDYEESQPVHAMEEIIRDFEKADVTDMIIKSDKYEASIFEVEEGKGNEFLAQKYNEYLKDKKVTFLKSKKYTDKNPVYVVKAGDETIAEVALESKERNNSNFKIWQLKNVDVSDYVKTIIKTSNIKIQVPQGTVVTVNGKGVSDDFITEETEISELKVLEGYIDVPSMYTYEITGLTKEPEVTAVYNGDELSLTVDKGMYTGTFTASDDFIGENESFATEVLEAYAKYFINVDKNLTKTYVMQDSQLYSSIKETSTFWYPNQYIESYGFSRKEVSDFKKYGDDCYSCKARYTIDIVFTPDYKHLIDDPTEKGDFEFFFVKKDDKWYLTAMTYIYD